VVECGDQLVLVDCGAGTLRRLMEAGYEGRAPSHIAFTHLHSDHVTGILDVLYASWVRRNPPVIVGPPGTEHFVGRLVESMAYDTRIRGGEGRRWSVGVQEVEEGSSFQADGSRWTAFRVDHQPVDQAFGYRFDEGSSSVVISGDTRPCANLVEQARNVSLLVHEAYLADALAEDVANAGNEMERSRFELLRSYHTSSLEVGEVAAQAGASQLALSHIYVGRSGRDDAALFLKDVRRHYAGDALVGEDLMTITI
jgi:ribonuclease Z